MKLPKQTRKRLFAGEVVEVSYPASENPPLRSGSSYSIQTDKGSVGRCRVMRQRRTDKGWSVAITHDIQEPARLLARTGADYTEFPGRALRGIEGGEAEAVDPEEIPHYTASKQAAERFRKHQGLAVAEKEDRDRLAKLKEEVRLHRKSKLDMVHISESLDRFIADLRKRREQVDEAA